MREEKNQNHGNKATLKPCEKDDHRRKHEEKRGREEEKKDRCLSMTAPRTPPLTTNNHQLVLRHGCSWGGDFATRRPNLSCAGLRAGWDHYMSAIIREHQAAIHCPTILQGVPIILPNGARLLLYSNFLPKTSLLNPKSEIYLYLALE